MTATENTIISIRPKMPSERYMQHVRVEEDHLDVEHDEDHGDEVEAHREALRADPSRRDDAALVGRVLGVVGVARAASSRAAKIWPMAKATTSIEMHDDRKVLGHCSHPAFREFGSPPSRHPRLVPAVQAEDQDQEDHQAEVPNAKPG